MNDSKNRSPKTTVNKKISAIDLFCGAGGLTKGLENAGINVRLGIDVDPVCEFPYTNNNKARFLLKSVEDLKAKELLPAFRENSMKLLAGCAPCQTFSTYNQKAGPTDKKWWLLLEFSRLVQELNPEFVTMENVPGLVDKDVYVDFVNTLKRLKYKVSSQVINCEEYGIPQQRKRLVLLASKLGTIELLKPSELNIKHITVRDAIGCLPPLHSGDVHGQDPLHQCSTLSELNLRRIRASRPGGTWRDWPKELIAECHKRGSGKTYGSVYGRMCWDEAAPTITTQFYGFGNGRFGHPEQDRAISLREGAILQSFPADYVFSAPGETISKSTVGRLIGNAVPVKLGEVIGKSIQKHLKEHINDLKNDIKE